MATVTEDFRRALQDIVAPDLKDIAREVRELKETVKSQGVGFYAAIQGLDHKIDDVKRDVDEKFDGVTVVLREIKTEIRQLGK